MHRCYFLACTCLHFHHKDMGGHHEDSLIRKEHRWAAAMASHSVRGPSSSMQLPVTGSQTGVSQPLPMPIPIQVTPEDLDHKDAIDTPATPPATLSAAEIVTPEVGKTYTHVSLFVFIFYSTFMIKNSICCLKFLLFLNSPQHCQRI